MALLFTVLLVSAIGTFGQDAVAPRDPNQHKQQGLSSLERGQFDRALVELRLAAEIDPRDGIVQDGIGVALGELGQIEQAIGSFQRAIDIAPDLALARFHLGLAFERSGHPRDAVA